MGFTLFTSAKAFMGLAKVQQRNAMLSWSLLEGDIDILLFGNDGGSSSVAKELGFCHVEEVECNKLGTPLLSDMFQQARNMAKHDVLCYINADIILFSDFAKAIGLTSAKENRCLMVGRRWDLDLNDPIDFEGDWEGELRGRRDIDCFMSHPSALDFFAFPKSIAPDMPGFAIGRPAWDNWLVMDFLRREIPIVDVSHDVFVVHPNHGYGHVKEQYGKRWEGVEADINRDLAMSRNGRFEPRLYSVLSATHCLIDGVIARATGMEYRIWRMRYLFLRLPRWLRFVVRPIITFPRLLAKRKMDWLG